MADYTSPKPVDPIWYQPDGLLIIHCGCGRIVKGRLEDFAIERQVDQRIKIYRMIARLRCTNCGKRPQFAEVRKRR